MAPLSSTMARACKANDESCSVMVVNDPKKVEGTGGKVRWNRPERKGWRGPAALRRLSSKQVVGREAAPKVEVFFTLTRLLIQEPGYQSKVLGDMHLFDDFPKAVP